VPSLRNARPAFAGTEATFWVSGTSNLEKGRGHLEVLQNPLNAHADVSQIYLQGGSADAGNSFDYI